MRIYFEILQIRVFCLCPMQVKVIFDGEADKSKVAVISGQQATLQKSS